MPVAEKIGNCACPLCRANARVSLSKSGLPVITCQGCHSQTFARSSHSDVLIRGMLRTDPPPAAAPPPAAPPQPEPAPAANPWNIW